MHLQVDLQPVQRGGAGPRDRPGDPARQQVAPPQAREQTVRQVSSEVKQVSSEMTRTSEMARTSELAVKESVVKQSVSTVKQINSKVMMAVVMVKLW